MDKNPTNYSLLLDVYQSLWNNRNLREESEKSEEILRATVKKDILDEMTHPRVRKNRFEKFYIASKRIVESALSDDDKQNLLQIYIEEMEKVNNL
ncbi:hypothetical protein ACLM5H_09365 [Fredinandcohnia humi]